MKRTCAISAFVLAVAFAVTAPHVNAQAPSTRLPRDAAHEQYRIAEQRAIDAAVQFVQQQSSDDSDAQSDDRQAFRQKLRQLVAESFDARQQLRLAELKELRRRLAEIEQAVEQREKHKDAIIDLHLDELMNNGSPVVQQPQKAQAGASAPIPSTDQDAKANAPALPTAPASAPPGMEAHVRYVQERVEVNGEVKTVTRPVIEYVKIASPEAPKADSETDHSTLEPRKRPNNDLNDEPQREAAESAFDINTREELAQLELEAAQAEYDAADKVLRATESSRSVISGSALAAREKEHRQAEYQLKRAKLNLEGLARQRAEIQSAAEAEVAEAEQEVKRASSQVAVAEADAAAARGQVEKLEAEAEQAQAMFSYRTKVYDRLKNLAEVQKAVDLKLVDEKEESVHAASAALLSAKAALPAGKARVEQTEAAIEEARAALHIAELRLKAAQDRRDRLMQRPRVDETESLDKQDAPPQKTSKANQGQVPMLAEIPYLARLFKNEFDGAEHRPIN